MKVLLKHKILKKLRETRSIPINALPKKLGISQEQYEKYETSDSKVPVEFADKLAGHFRRNWTVFLLDDLPKETVIDRDNRTEKNVSPTLHEKTFAAIEDANFILEFSKTLEITQELNIPNKSSVESLDPESLGQKERTASGITLDEQQRFGSDSAALNRWIQLIESKGIFVSQFPLNPEDKIKAFSIYRDNRAIIVLNTGDIIVARIFSLLHEYSHILRRSYGLCDLHNSRSSDAEVSCNRFAASFLVPSEAITSYIESIGETNFKNDLDGNVKKIANQLKVSQLVIYRRLTTFGYISSSEYSKIHERYLAAFTRPVITRIPTEDESQKRGGPNYYVTKRLNNGISYSSRVFDAFDTGNITSLEASNALGISAKNLESYRNITAQYKEKWGSLP